MAATRGEEALFKSIKLWKKLLVFDRADFAIV